MGPDTIWVLIPLLALSIPIFKIWTRHNQKIAEIQAQATAERAAQYATHNQALEDRVRVLERIVTDKGYDVAAQIEALRDQRRVDEDGQGVSIESLRRERA
jgi:IS5 family transposase